MFDWQVNHNIVKLLGIRWDKYPRWFNVIRAEWNNFWSNKAVRRKLPGIDRDAQRKWMNDDARLIKRWLFQIVADSTYSSQVT